MNRFLKYITVISLALCLICVMVMPSFAAVVSQDITSQQMAVIMDIGSFQYIGGYYVGYQQSNNFTYGTVTTTNGVDIYARELVSGQTIGSSADQRNLLDPSIFVFGDEPSATITRVHIQLQPNTTYTLSSDIPFTRTASNQITGYLYFANENGVFNNTNNTLVRSGVSRSVTTGSSGVVDIGYRNLTTTEVDFADYWFQLEQGSSATTYMPYKPYISFNIPLYLSGFDSLTVQFAVAGSFTNILNFDSVYCIDDSVATPVTSSYLGTLQSTNYSVYPWQLYQVTFESDVDIAQFRFLPTSVVSDSSFTLAFGTPAISVVADDSVIEGISAQINSINTKISQLISAIDDLQTALDGLVIQNGDVVTNLQEINNIANSIEENQELMLYLTENEELVVQNITNANTSNTTKINQYISIMQQYAENYPTVNNVENIIESGVPSSEAIAVAVAPIQSLFDATWFIGILATLGAVALLSYVLFGKR